ncbi:J domain-containing protein [Pseudomonas sp. D(2018)]|uniref:J domain-containing protein n=1 Tax=Pseudomonas sp. D(2018) TaxID=2502238 RepID=UPI0010F4952D|nr:J domain-containing protein [Pseudomonas sp. D(2018)]
MRTHYDNLHISEKASPEVIRAAYKTLAQKWHPDKHPTDRAKAEHYFKIISQAFEVLSDEASRCRYDASLHQQRDVGSGRKQGKHTPPPKSHQDLMAEAWESGKYSREKGFGTDSCPYKGVYAEAWLEGHRTGTPPQSQSEARQQQPKSPSAPVPRDKSITDMISNLVAVGFAVLAVALLLVSVP